MLILSLFCFSVYIKVNYNNNNNNNNNNNISFLFSTLNMPFVATLYLGLTCQYFVVCLFCFVSSILFKLYLIFTTLWTTSVIQQTTNWWFFLCPETGLDISCKLSPDIFFLIFPIKQDLTFHANCLQWRQFAWNVKSCFLGKIRKIFQYVVCWKFYPEC